MSEIGKRKPGWDGPMISKIANRDFGGYPGFFKSHGWSETGSQMMPKVQRRVKESYGSVENFFLDSLPADPFENDPDIFITSFWDFTPETWGCVGFSQAGRRDTFLKTATDPFIMVIFVTPTAPAPTPHEIRGKVMGFYEVTHRYGHRNDFVAPELHDIKPESWQHSLKATRAYEIPAEFRPNIEEFEPRIHQNNRQRSVAKDGAKLSQEAIKILKALPWAQSELFKGNLPVNSDINVPHSSKAYRGRNFVRGGNANRSGYQVGETDSVKDLYLLKLAGPLDDYLDEPSDGRIVIKIGLSISPQTRRKSFQKALPKGRFKWIVERTTRLDGHEPYSCFAVAEAGEMAMKEYLARTSTWLNGEFYLVDPDIIETAWEIGRQAALENEKASAANSNSA